MREGIETAVTESYLVDGVPIHVAASIGVAHFPDHAATAEELLQKASIAMHWATSSKSDLSLYNTANDRTSRDNLILLGGLSDAIERGELQVWHQAQIALATGDVAGTEALLRWKHPQRGMVPPGSFIPQVEETTLINSVTRVMIAAAFADAGSWHAAGHRLRVSVNLSVRNLRDHMLVEVLEQNARRNELEASRHRPGDHRERGHGGPGPLHSPDIAAAQPWLWRLHRRFRHRPFLARLFAEAARLGSQD